MFAFKLKKIGVCENCGEALPPYLSRYHRVILFTKGQKESFSRIVGRSKLEGEFIEYGDQYQTIGFDEECCKDEIKLLRDELKAAHEEIERLKNKLNNI
jgi:hypothetical protein